MTSVTNKTESRTNPRTPLRGSPLDERIIFGVRPEEGRASTLTRNHSDTIGTDLSGVHRDWHESIIVSTALGSTGLRHRLTGHSTYHVNYSHWCA